eukprot:m.507203 g.507203  ORF g.507203 m.507203 type:complete len:153 (-) comp57381_c0_seq14:827-1285(-)
MFALALRQIKLARSPNFIVKCVSSTFSRAGLTHTKRVVFALPASEGSRRRVKSEFRKVAGRFPTESAFMTTPNCKRDWLMAVPVGQMRVAKSYGEIPTNDLPSCLTSRNPYLPLLCDSIESPALSQPSQIPQGRRCSADSSVCVHHPSTRDQ